MNTTQTTLANELAAQSAKIYAATEAGRSVSTMNRLWKKYFQIEDALKSYSKGGF